MKFALNEYQSNHEDTPWRTRFEYMCVNVTDEEHWNRESITFSQGGNHLI